MAKVSLKVSPKTGGEKKIGDTVIPEGKGKVDKQLDVRDRLAELVGKGNALTPDEKMAILGDLSSSLGKDKAMKIMNHAYIFNQRPDILKLPLEDKIKAFYTIGSNDKDVNDLITKSKTLGYGVLPGFRESSSATNQVLAGRISPTVQVPANSETQQRILLSVNK